MAAAPRKVTPDNGYFEAWERACGHRYRISTESWSGSLKRAVLPRLRAEAAARPCSQCPAEAVA